MKRHLQCAEQAQSASNITTKSVSSTFQRKLRELLPPIERRFDDNPTIIRRQSDQKIASRTRRFGDLTRPILETHFVLKNPPAPVGAKGRVFPEALAIGSFS